MKHFQKGFTILPKESSYITKINHNLSFLLFDDYSFLKFLTRTHSIKKLTLESITQYPRKPEEPEIKRIVRKIFVLCPKLQDFSLKLIDCTKYTVPFPFKYLLLAKSLKHFSCNFETSFFEQFQYLVDYFIWANRRGLKHSSFFDFIIQPGYFGRFEDRSLEDLREIIQKIIYLSKKPALRFDLYSDGDEETLRFCQIFSKLQNPVKFIIQQEEEEEEEPGHHLLQLLKTIPSTAHITKLELLSIRPSESPDVDPLDYLTHFLLTAKSLTSLNISLAKFTKNSSSVNSFIKQLQECSELSSLTLEFQKCECVDDLLLRSLTKSLQNLPKFTNLNLTCDSSSSSSGMQGFFDSIKTLRNLKKLKLILQGSSKPVSNEEFTALCKSLENLHQLQQLKIYLPKSKIQDQGVAYLSTTISQLKKLHTFDFYLDTKTGKALSSKSITQLFGCLMNLQFLSSLQLILLCQETSLLCAKSLIPVLSNMKSLNKLSLSLTGKNWNPLARAEFEALSQRFEKKFEATINCYEHRI